MASAKTATLTFRIKPAIKDGLLAVAREYRSIAYMVAVMIRTYCGDNDVQIPLQPLVDGRLLIISGFRAGENRNTTELAIRRNEFVAALADEFWFAHITAGGQMAKLAQCPWIKAQIVSGVGLGSEDEY